MSASAKIRIGVLNCAVILAAALGFACAAHDAQFKSDDRDVHKLIQRLGVPDAYEIEHPASPEFGLGTPKDTSGHYRLYYLAQNKTVKCNGNNVLATSETDTPVKSMILTPLLKKGYVTQDEVTAYLTYENELRQIDVSGPAVDLDAQNRNNKGQN
jgi:hypothetical protein